MIISNCYPGNRASGIPLLTLLPYRVQAPSVIGYGSNIFILPPNERRTPFTRLSMKLMLDRRICQEPVFTTEGPVRRFILSTLRQLLALVNIYAKAIPLYILGISGGLEHLHPRGINCLGKYSAQVYPSGLEE